MPRPHILIAVGARPNFMKAAPLARALKATRRARVTLVHTGQHYSAEMSSSFFRDLRLPRPKLNLGVGSGSHGKQISEILLGFEAALLKLRPDAVVVVGDVNSTLACALAACKMPADIRPLLAHVEAGLRSFDRSMPEEANRVMTDHVSDLLFAPSRDAVEHLRKEGIPSERIFLVGNVMIDSLRHAAAEARASRILSRLRLSHRGYALVTLHRPSNVDESGTSEGLIRSLLWLQQRLPVLFPMHPRTRKEWGRRGFLKRLASRRNARLVDPLGYLDFLKAMSSARVVLTDSGGIQEETTILRVPCLTLRTTTERPITISNGTNRLAGVAPRRIIAACREILRKPAPRKPAPPLWDGRAAERISRILIQRLSRP